MNLDTPSTFKHHVESRNSEMPPLDANACVAAKLGLLPLAEQGKNPVLGEIHFVHRHMDDLGVPLEFHWIPIGFQWIYWVQ